MIEAEDFAAWRANPITQAVFAMVRQWADSARKSWVDASWEAGNADPVILAGCRGAADMANDILGMDAETLKEERDDTEEKTG